MGTRRDDISASQRAQIAVEALSPYRPRGTISRLARENGVSRQAIYDMAAAGKAILETHLTPGPHGPQLPETTLRVDRDRLVRGSVRLTEAGVSQRDVSECLAELLGHPCVAQLGERETGATGCGRRGQCQLASGRRGNLVGRRDLFEWLAQSDAHWQRFAVCVCLDPAAHV